MFMESRGCWCEDERSLTLVWIVDGGCGCGQVDEDAHTRLESGEGGGCGQVDEDPRTRLQSGGCVGRSTKVPRARLRSGGWH